MSEENKPVFGSVDDVFDQDRVITPPTPPVGLPPEPATVENEEVLEEPTSSVAPKATTIDQDNLDTPEVISKEEQERRRKEVFDTVLGPTAPNPETLKDSNAKVNLSHNPLKDLSKRDFDEYMEKHGDNIEAIPTVTYKQFQRLVDGIPNVDLRDTPRNREIMDVYQSAYDKMPRGGALQSTVDDERRDFYQELPVEDTVLKPMRQKVSLNPSTIPSGEQAVIRMNLIMGKGGTFKFPLYHSGFWVAIKNPPDSRLIDMEYDIMQSKIFLGRHLEGNIFSNDRLYMIEILMRLFRDCIYQTSLQDSTGDIFDKIKLHDVNTIAWAMACIIYPNGIPYSRIIYSEDMTENRVVNGIVDISKLLWVDRNALTEKQMKHLCRHRKPCMSDLEIKDYQENFNIKTEKRVKLTDSASVILTIPSVNDYLIYGQNWINECIARADGIIAEDNEETKKNALITNYFKADLLSQFRHFIKSVILTPEGGDEEVYDESATVDKMVSALSDNDEIRDTLLKEIYDFADSTQVAVVATPTATDEKTQTDNFPHLVQMDPVYTFFTLLVRKTRVINSRRLM